MADSEESEHARLKRRERLKKAVAKTAPRIAAQLGGPLAGAAVSAIARAIFGKDVADEDALADAIDRASPEQAIALKRAEYEFMLALRAAAVEETRIDAGDRASARERQAKMKDWTPSALGALIIGGFFLTLAFMVARKLPAGAETEFSIMLGALATMTAAVVNYFFGSSAGSREKTLLLTGVKRPEEE
ncbi:MAG: hypothetical protein R3C42_00255 [Parvularculaceae bacterium]|nr:hypothetical protein [Parvularculaceae bacterium]